MATVTLFFVESQKKKFRRIIVSASPCKNPYRLLYGTREKCLELVGETQTQVLLWFSHSRESRMASLLGPERRLRRRILRKSSG